MEFNLFLPQMRLSFEQLVTRARAAEAAGFVGMTGMDHVAPPLAQDQPMFTLDCVTGKITERLVGLRRAASTNGIAVSMSN